MKPLFALHTVDHPRAPGRIRLSTDAIQFFILTNGSFTLPSFQCAFRIAVRTHPTWTTSFLAFSDGRAVGMNSGFCWCFGESVCLLSRGRFDRWRSCMTGARFCFTAVSIVVRKKQRKLSTSGSRFYWYIKIIWLQNIS